MKDVYIAPVLLTGGKVDPGEIDNPDVRPSMQGGEHPQPEPGWGEE